METLAVIRALHSAGLDFSLLAAAPVAGLALGLSVDYSLLLIGRYREELSTASNDKSALQASLRAVGPTIVASAMTIVVALAPMALFPIPFLSSISMAAGYCAIIAAFNAMTTVPIILTIYGDRITREAALGRYLPFRKRHTPRYWTTVPKLAIRSPRRVILIVTALLLIIAIPAAFMRVGSISPEAVLGHSESNHVTDVARKQFDSSISHERYTVLITAPVTEAAGIRAVDTRIRALPHVEAASSAQFLGGSVWKIEVEGSSSIGSSVSKTTVEELQEKVSSQYTLDIASPAAVLVDRDHALTRFLPIVLLCALVIVFVLLFAFTDSFLLPIKLLLMTTVTIAVTLGTMAVIFQAFVDVSDTSTFDAAQIVTLVVITLALVTDYGVFVTGRILEAHRSGMSDDSAIACGLAKTGPIVSAAAMVFCVAVGAFALSDVRLISQLSVGMTIAVLIDASVVRTLLVPAWMVLLGRYNWWAPATASAIRRRVLD